MNRELLIEQMGITPYPSKWTHRDRLMVKRTATMMFLQGNQHSLRDCASWLLDCFGQATTSIHPYFPVQVSTAKRSEFEAQILNSESLSSLLTCGIDDFVPRVRQHIENGGEVDSMLYVHLMTPKVRFDLNKIEMVNLPTIIEMKYEQDKARRAKRQKPAVTPPALAPAKVEVPSVVQPVHQLHGLSPKAVELLNTLANSGNDFEEVSLNLMYLNDNLAALIAEQQRTNRLLVDLRHSGVTVPAQVVNALPAIEMTPTRKRHRILVVGMWPRQYESFRLQFKSEFFDNFELDYVSSDKLRANTLKSTAGYDSVLVNTSAINHSVEELVRSTKCDFERYMGGMTALKTLLIGKINQGVFGEHARKNIFDWVK